MGEGPDLPSCSSLVFFLPHRSDSEVLTFQHADFKKLPPRAEEAEGAKAETSLVLKQPKKAKKRKSTQEIIPVPPTTPGSSLPPESATAESEWVEETSKNESGLGGRIGNTRDIQYFTVSLSDVSPAFRESEK